MTPQLAAIAALVVWAVVLIGVIASVESLSLRIRRLEEQLQDVEHRHEVEEAEAVRRRLYPKRDHVGRIIDNGV